jgi:Zn finger protein HypA/HybF involved in hydrogenase expression
MSALAGSGGRCRGSGVMAILLAPAKGREIGRISRVRLIIRRLRGYRRASAAFELFSEGSIAGGVQLDIEEIAVEERCCARGIV